MRARPLLYLALSVGLLAGGWGGLRWWKHHVVTRQDDRQFAEITAAVQAKDFGRAQSLLDLHRQQVTNLDSPHDWAALEVAVLAGTRNLPQLLTLHGQRSAAFLADEDACLLVARALLAQRQFTDLEELQARWKASSRPAAWALVQTDRLLADHRSDEARGILQAEKFSGDDEAARLSRLALLANDPRDLTASWNLLADAAEVAPRNPDVRSFRGQILETVGKPQLARVEYVAAHVAAPHDPLLRDQLAEFYRRQGSLDAALATWRDALKSPAPDFIRVKEAFWSRMVQPAAGAPAAATGGPLAPVVLALQAPGFADFAPPVGKGVDWTAHRQEALWSRALHLLEQGDEAAAASLLRETPFRSASFHPVLHRALVRVLNWRANGRLVVPGFGGETPHNSNQHQLFDQLDAATQAQATSAEATVPAELARVLSGPRATGALLLAAGWREAALQFLEKSPPTAEDPAWLAYGYAQLLRLNRTDAAALAFLEGNHATAELRLLRAEALLVRGRADDASAELAALSTGDGPVATRAAWITATRAFEAGKLDDARRLVSSAPLAGTTTAAEMLARLALAANRPEDAARHYSSVQTDSIEARTWLARRAYATRNFATARRLTEELLALMPDEVQLRQNLAAIARAENSPPQ